MKEKLKLFVCENFKKEIECSIKALEVDEITISCYPSACFDCAKKRQNFLKSIIGEEGTSINGTILSCFDLKDEQDKQEFINSKTFELCHSLLAGNTLVQNYIAEGNYLLTPGWLLNWKHYIIEIMGFDKHGAKEFFTEGYKKLLLLDSGVYDGIEESLKELSDFVGLEYLVLPVGLDYFKSNLLNIYQDYKLKQLNRWVNDKNKQVADFTLVIDFMEKVAALLKQEDLVNNIFDLFVLMTGASNLSFLPVISGSYGKQTFYNDQRYNSELTNHDNIPFENQYKMTSAGEGFLLKLSFNNDILGYIEVENIPFPNYINSYLDLSKTVINIFSLSLFNSRTYEKSLKLNDELQELNSELENKVLERTSELIKAKVKAENANLAKQNFLANMSHEIRTPMNGIIGMTELTLMTEITDEQRRNLNLVKKSMNSLLVIINDILDYTRIEEGKMVLEIKPFNLRDAINEIVELFIVSAEQKGLTITYEVEESIPLSINGDMIRLRQVLSNLVGNSVKFTQSGGIHITVDAERFDLNRVRLLFTVKDTGIGIPVEQRKLLFERFSQLDSSYTKKFQGTGLGLAISKKIVEKMEGEIWIDSEYCSGSKFCFTAQFGVDDRNKHDRQHNGYLHNLGKETKGSKKILIVEDDEISRMLLIKLLGMKDIEYVVAENGEKAIEIFKNEKVDMIFMDIQMPILDGFSATKAIRELEGSLHIHIPIIATTAYAFIDDRERCIKAGMDGYLSKPLDFRQVINVIDKYLG